MKELSKVIWTKRFTDIGKWFLNSAIIPVVITFLTLNIIQKPYDEKLVILAQQYAYYNAIAVKKIEYSEKMIVSRQKALTWLDIIISDYFNKRAINTEKWFNMSEEAQSVNSGSLLYSFQPYNAVMSYDTLFSEIMLDIFHSNYLTKDDYALKRKRLGFLFDKMIDSLRRNTIEDSSWSNFTNKYYYDVEKK